MMINVFPVIRVIPIFSRVHPKTVHILQHILFCFFINL